MIYIYIYLTDVYIFKWYIYLNYVYYTSFAWLIKKEKYTILIFVVSIEIRLYLHFSEWFWTKLNSLWFQINRFWLINAIWFWLIQQISEVFDVLQITCAWNNHVFRAWNNHAHAVFHIACAWNNHVFHAWNHHAHDVFRITCTWSNHVFYAWNNHAHAVFQITCAWNNHVFLSMVI